MSIVSAKQKIVFGRHSTGMILTPKEFDAIEDYDENYCYELINGVVVVSAVPLATERGPNELLGHYLLSYQEHHPHGSALDLTLPHEYVRTPKSRRIADRLIWTGLGRVPSSRNDVPTIAVEFVSKGKRNRERDYIHKKREYGKTGMKEYWIIDRFRRTMTVVSYKPKGAKEQIVPESDIYQTPLLPGFELPLARILEAADRLAKAR